MSKNQTGFSWVQCLVSREMLIPTVFKTVTCVHIHLFSLHSQRSHDDSFKLQTPLSRLRRSSVSGSNPFTSTSQLCFSDKQINYFLTKSKRLNWGPSLCAQSMEDNLHLPEAFYPYSSHIINGKQLKMWICVSSKTMCFLYCQMSSELYRSTEGNR